MNDVFHDRHARGRTRTGWLDAHHTFSFGSFNDPARMGFRALRVINEDVIAGGSGFPEHAHDHFEILSFILEGTLEHSDSEGNLGVLQAGDVQLISSGRGIRHAERNPSPSAPVHLFQVWLHGQGDGEAPRYQHLPGAIDRGPSTSRLVAGPEEQPDVLAMRAAVRIWAGNAGADETCTHVLQPSRFGWLQLLDGVAEVRADEEDPMELRGGDALQLSTVRRVHLRARAPSRWLWFDLD